MARKPRTDGKPPRTKRLDRPHAEDRPGLTESVPADTGYGGNKILLNREALFEAAKTHASFDTLGLIFGCSAMLLSDKNKEWRPIIDEARAHAKRNLLAAQFQTAINDRNPTMLIWMGKQFLDQKDVSRTEHAGVDGQPIKTDNTTRAVAYIPENGRNDAPDDRSKTPLPHGQQPSADSQRGLER